MCPMWPLIPTRCCTGPMRAGWRRLTRTPLEISTQMQAAALMAAVERGPQLPLRLSPAAAAAAPQPSLAAHAAEATAAPSSAPPYTCPGPATGSAHPLMAAHAAGGAAAGPTLLLFTGPVTAAAAAAAQSSLAAHAVGGSNLEALERAPRYNSSSQRKPGAVNKRTRDASVAARAATAQPT